MNVKELIKELQKLPLSSRHSRRIDGNVPPGPLVFLSVSSVFELKVGAILMNSPLLTTMKRPMKRPSFPMRLLTASSADLIKSYRLPRLSAGNRRLSPTREHFSSLPRVNAPGRGGELSLSGVLRG